MRFGLAVLPVSLTLTVQMPANKVQHQHEHQPLQESSQR